jgi:hypothetical protein
VVSPGIERVENGGTRPPPNVTRCVPESSDDDENCPNSRNGHQLKTSQQSKKRKRTTSNDFESDAPETTDDNDHQAKSRLVLKKKRPRMRANTQAESESDSDVEIVEKSEDAAEELGQSTKFRMLQSVVGLNLYSAERLAKDWTSPIYAFFHPCPTVETVNGRRCHEFICAAQYCKGKGGRARVVRRFLDTSDAKSTGNLWKHARMCWGTEIVEQADGAKDISSIRTGLAAAKTLKNGSITASFQPQMKGKMTYMSRQYTYKEARYVGHQVRTYGTLTIIRQGRIHPMASRG